MKFYYCIANRFYVVNDSQTCDNVANYIRVEYKDYYIHDASSCSKPVIGYIKEECGAAIFQNVREVVKDWLYVDDSYLYVKYNNRYTRISLNPDNFELLYQSNFEGNVLFYVMEVLIRIYSHKFGIDFFHASSFRYKDKVFMLNGFGGAGKTEIMVDFLLHGAGFISDDIVIVNERGMIYPYKVRIPIKWSCINRDFVDKIKISPIIYDICAYCKKKNGRITRRIYGKLASKYLLGYYSHQQLTATNTELKFYTVDQCIWLQEANHSGPFKISNDKFIDYMDICMANESRTYFDLEGFLLLKFPQIRSFYAKRYDLRKNICDALIVKGLAVKDANYKNAIQYLLLEL